MATTIHPWHPTAGMPTRERVLPLMPGLATDGCFRLAVASAERSLVAPIMDRLRGRPIRVAVTRTPEALGACLDLARPHAALVAEGFVPDLTRLVQALARRHPAIPILLVSGEASSLSARPWEVSSWGAVGVIARADLLREGTLLGILRDLAPSARGGATRREARAAGTVGRLRARLTSAGRPPRRKPPHPR